MPNFIETSDFLNRATVLRSTSSHRVPFEPNDANHQASLKQFIETGNWGKTQFLCEYPYTDVPMTVMMKFAGKALGVSRETAATRMARLDATAVV